MAGRGSADSPLRVAIVGSGPSGFYAAEALLKAGMPVKVDMFDRLPTPFGLVRGGVAPDHAKIKRVIHVFERIAAEEALDFFGNVAIGRDLSVDDLRKCYDGIIFACGAETDRKLNIPGEDLPGSHTATEFVGWYNGHPDFQDRSFDLSRGVVAVIGQGNVAIDVARILAKTADELRQTDIARHALDALAESKVREIHLIGRRGPVQAKFTTNEIREFGDLPECDPVVDPADLDVDPVSHEELLHPENKQSPKNLDVLREFAARPAPAKRKRVVLQFLRSPVALQGDGRVEHIVLEHNRLEGEAFHQRAVGTGITEEFPCGLVFRSVGYHGVPIPGVPFDEMRGTFPNAHGRILDGGEPMPGLYAAGWIKRGPSGIIGNNKPDSKETVHALLDDAPGLPHCEVRDSGAVREQLAARGVRVVSFDDWRAIDAAEIARGEAAGKPREKFTRIDEMLAVLG